MVCLCPSTQKLTNILDFFFLSKTSNDLLPSQNASLSIYNDMRLIPIFPSFTQSFWLLSATLLFILLTLYKFIKNTHS